MDPRFNQGAAPDAFNPYLYAQQNAALSRNQQPPNLSANAPEFIPKFSAPLGAAEWNHPQESPAQTFQQQQHLPPQMYAPNTRPFPPHQHQPIPFAGPNQQQPRSSSHYVYPQQNRSYAAAAAANTHHHEAATHNHVHNHYPNYSNNHHAPHVVHHQSHGGGSNSYHQRGGVHNRLNNASHSEAAAHSSGPPQQQQTETERIALDFLDEVVSKMKSQPELFEKQQKRLCELFSELTDNHFVLSNVIELIFEHSINEQNFRYTGARLCALFDSLDLSPNSTFRNLLVMKMEFQNTEQVPFMQNDQRRVRGTTLFLAELFVHFSKLEDEQRVKIDVARFVLDSIMLLLTKPGPENIKCVCQTLKLAGYELQTEHPTDVEDAINQLKVIAEEQNIQTKRLIESVVEMFYNNWGRKDQVEENQTPSTSEHPDHLPLPSNYNESAVFYGPDGQIISEEESSFLNENLPSSYPINIDEIIDDDSDDFIDDDDEPEMDLEMRMAYKEFIAGAGNKDQANKQNNRPKK